MSHYTLRDAGQEDKFSLESPVKKNKWYQSLNFNINQLPEIGLWRPGEKYTLVIKVKEVEHKVEKAVGQAEETARFEVLEVATLNSDYQEVSQLVKSKLNIK